MPSICSRSPEDNSFSMHLANEDTQLQCSRLHTSPFVIYEWYPKKFCLKSTLETLSTVLYFCTYMKGQTSNDFIRMKTTFHTIYKQMSKAVKSVVQMSVIKYSQELNKVKLTNSNRSVLWLTMTILASNTITKSSIFIGNCIRKLTPCGTVWLHFSNNFCSL